MRNFRVLTATVVTAGLLAACGSGSEAGGPLEGVSDLNALIEAAQEEGELVLYVGASGFENDVTQVFQDKYGIAVQATRLPSSDVAPRYSAEINAGAPTADLLVVSEDGFVEDARSQGWMMDPADAGIPGYPWDYPEDMLRGEQVLVQLRPWAIAWNTDLVQPEDAPDSFDDLLDPAWKGKILMSNPETAKAYVDLFHVLDEEFGDGFLEELGAQEPVLFDSAAPALESLSAGEGSIGAPSGPSQLVPAKERGAPIDFLVPEITVSYPVELGLTADEHSDHPYAARLFAHWLLSEEGQQVAADSMFLPNSYDVDMDAVYLPREYDDARRDEVISKIVGS